MGRFLVEARRGLAELLARLRHRPAAPLSPIAPPPAERPYPWEASYPEGVVWDADIPVAPASEILDRAVATWPDRPCLEFLGKRYGYAEVGRLVARTAKGLQAAGVGKGVRVGLFLPNTAYYVICFYAVLKAGGTVVNFNPLYAEREIARQIRDSGTRVMITMNLNTLYPKVARQLDSGLLERIVICTMGGALSFRKRALFTLFKRREVAAIPSDAAHIKFSRLIANDGLPEAVAIDPARDLAVLQYTGGTTGHPKGAMLTHANLYANVVQTRLWARDFKAGEERVLAVLPLFHVFGMTAVMNLALHSGAELVLLPRFKTAETLAIIDRERPTIFMGVPTIYSAINEHKGLEAYDLSSLRYCISGGAPLPKAVRSRFEALTGCTLVEGYGLTEAAPVCTINPATGPDKPGSAGLPLPRTAIRICALDDPAKILAAGEPGEVCVSGPQVMQGYWKQDEETRGVLSDGWLRTGDVGYLDGDGYLFLIDRIKDLVISGGFNVYPRMVEEAILLHPAVAEAAVCGVPDRHRGEVVKAFVRLRDGMTLTGGALREYLKDKLAPFEIPRKIEFRESIPRTLVGKPLRRVLVEQEKRRLGQTLGDAVHDIAAAEVNEATRAGMASHRPEGHPT